MGDDGTAYALIFAGGTGSRLSGAKVPKQFLELAGKPIIAHTLDHFQRHEAIRAIVIACLADWIPVLDEVVTAGGYTKVAAITPGGATGQESIYNGLVALDELGVADDAVVLVHDGVRPLIDEATITRCIESVRAHGATATIAPAIETILETGDDGIRVIQRDRCAMARAPQGFRFGELYADHRQARARSETYIDSISLAAAFGRPIFTVEGPVDNIKITTRRDFFAFKGYMDYKEMEQLW